MIYLMENGEISIYKDRKMEYNQEKSYIGVCSYEEAPHYAKSFHVHPKFLKKILSNRAIRFESLEDMDIICVPVMDLENLHEDPKSMYMFIGKNHFLIVIEEDALVKNIIKEISEDDTIDASFGRLLYDFFDKLLEEDNQYIDAFEDEIMELEDEVIANSESKDYVSCFVQYRKKLFTLKRYYEQMITLFNLILVNENKLLDKQSLRLLKILGGQLERLHGSVMFLNEYITQIREAYQSEVDINLNKVMKVFTVITAIFNPLTLIAGWYGMNLKMPEFNFAYSYPLVIFGSLLVTAVTITIFKKKKWF